jgi:hypothetical protein
VIGKPFNIVFDPSVDMKPDSVYIDINVPVKALVNTRVLEGILFGDSRITSSRDFSVGSDVGKTYANAVHKFQQYSNISVGENITIVPTSHHRMPLVLSMRCPKLNLSHTMTTTTSSQNHEKFGPNHTTRIVEVMDKFTPFVTACCEARMNIPRDIVDDILEDRDMPVAKSSSLEHCFAHSQKNGVSAYVATHTFTLPTAILNTHTVTQQGTKEQPETNGQPFPVEEKLVFHVAALFGGAVS